MKRSPITILTAVLLLFALCIGCAKVQTNDPAPTAAPSPAPTEVPVYDADGIPIRWKNGGTLRFLSAEPIWSIRVPTRTR